jgi:hypothetical protein
MAFTKGSAPKTPGKKGVITAVLNMKNIGIDNKTLMLIDDRLGMVREMNLQIGDPVEYRQLSQGIDKGKINFLGRDTETPARTPAVTAPAEPAAPKEAPDTQDIQAEYVGKEQTRITLKDCKGQEQQFRADLDVIKMLAKPDSPVQPGNKYRARIVKQGTEWVVMQMGKFDQTFEEKPFWTGAEILKENLESKKAETAQADAALAQINASLAQINASLAQISSEEAAATQPVAEEDPNLKFCATCQTRDDCKKHGISYGPGCGLKIRGILTKAAEDAAGDARIKENADHVKELVKDTQQAPPTVPAVVPAKVPEKHQQNASVTVLETLAECPVELKVHLDCGSYSNFDLTVPGLPIDQALAKIEQDGQKAIAMMHRLMAASKKGF